MDEIYKLIEGYPKNVAAVFALTNGVWLLVTFILRQKHERAIQRTKHAFDLDLERRKKVFEMKARQYEDYVGLLDDFGRKNQVEIPSKMQPMIQRFFADYLKAEDESDAKGSRQAITSFSSDISTLTQDSLNDFLKLKSESNKLKLTATPELLAIFGELESATQVSFDAANKFMGDFLGLITNQRQDEIAQRQKGLASLSEDVVKKSDELMVCMRNELSEI